MTKINIDRHTLEICELEKQNKRLRRALRRFIEGLKNDPYYVIEKLGKDLRFAEKVLEEEK